jgi:hypothetical protein
MTQTTFSDVVAKFKTTMTEFGTAYKMYAAVGSTHVTGNSGV